ncbi:MAG: hypothetical protein L6425_07410, partial [Candidatus Aminicenantes bacterium]|nr:hypothetical protein [Candidatus Aminicenantes bacterium]
AIEPMYDESEATWREFFRKLNKRRTEALSLHLRCPYGDPECFEKGMDRLQLAAVQGPFCVLSSKIPQKNRPEFPIN